MHRSAVSQLLKLLKDLKSCSKQKEASLVHLFERGLSLKPGSILSTFWALIVSTMVEELLFQDLQSG